MSDATLLEMRDVSVRYATARRSVHALRNVSLDIPRGKIVGLVGESGSGKSTLLMTIMDLLGPGAELHGAISFDGRDLARLSPAERRALRGSRISMVFQNPMTTLSPVVRIDRQMVDIQHRESRLGRAQKLERAAAMLAKVGIPDPKARLKAYPHQMSGGMLQRISIGMALLAEPDLLIADEPTTALDATLEVQILELLRELQRLANCSILYVSHHLGTVAQLCDHVAVMYAGSIVEQGTTREVLKAPRHPYTRRLLACDPSRLNRLDGALPTIPGAVPSLDSPPKGCAFRPRCDVAIGRCEIEVPGLRDRGGHAVACHLASDTGGSGNA
ncbi:MAG: ABC transporter ATP-binding protein [Parvibaculaceae bacterium]